MRVWLSGPRILGGLVRPGISLGREDLHKRLPSWRRFELRAQLKAGAIARGEAMTRDECDYVIDKALATGVLDSVGDLTFHLKGSREEITQGILERCTAWHHPMTRGEAERLTDKAIRPSPWPAIVMTIILLAGIVWAVAAHADERLHDGAPCFNDYGEDGTYYSGHCYVDDDD